MNPIKSCGDPNFQRIEFAWHLTDWCNYKCSYCPVLHVVTNDFTQPRHADYKMVLARLGTVQRNFQMCLSGGEPTLHPQFLDIVNKMSAIDNCVQIAVMTNLSRSVDFYKQVEALNVLNKFNENKLLIMAAYHPEYYKDKFLEKAIELHQHCREFVVQLNLKDQPDTWDSTQLVIERLLEKKVKTRLNLLISNQNFTANYTSEFHERFGQYFDDTDHPFEIPVEFEDGTHAMLKDHEIEINHWNKFQGYECTPVYYSISREGVITNLCTNREVGLSLGDNNLVRKEICPREVCLSKQTLEFPKKKL